MYPVELNEIDENKDKLEKFNKLFKDTSKLSNLLELISKPDEFKFHISTGNYFITSDNPVVSTYGKNKDSGFQIIMPISPFVCITFQMGDVNCSDNLIVRMTDEKIKYVNEMQINTANYFVISHAKFTLEQRKYVEFRFNNKDWYRTSRHFIK